MRVVGWFFDDVGERKFQFLQIQNSLRFFMDTTPLFDMYISSDCRRFVVRRGIWCTRAIAFPEPCSSLGAHFPSNLAVRQPVLWKDFHHSTHTKPLAVVPFLSSLCLVPSKATDYCLGVMRRNFGGDFSYGHIYQKIPGPVRSRKSSW